MSGLWARVAGQMFKHASLRRSPETMSQNVIWSNDYIPKPKAKGCVDFFIFTVCKSLLYSKTLVEQVSFHINANLTLFICVFVLVSIHWGRNGCAGAKANQANIHSHLNFE